MLQQRNQYPYGILTMTQDVKNTEYVFLIFTCSYRFGRDDLDVLGLTFQKELLIYTKCLWPNHSLIIDKQLPIYNNIKNQTKKTWKNKFKRKIKKKIESIEDISSILPPSTSPSSVAIQTTQGSNNKKKIMNIHLNIPYL
uniref:Arrestin-C n=1 Tax=Schistosoma haematobium TaxID=6185 RepID=A0A094ZKU0_SCHHA